MSLSLLSVDSYSVSDSDSTPLLFCVSTLLVAQSPSENACCLPEFVPLSVLLESPASLSLFSVLSH